MKIKLSDDFTYQKLLRFALPSIGMMVFTSIYGVIDGFFVSNFAGKEALASVNLIFPLVMALSCTGYMIGTGGAALIAKIMGERDGVRANRLFTFIIIFALALGIVLSIIGSLAMHPFLETMGAEGGLVRLAEEYGFILFVFLSVFILAAAFQSFLVAAEKPHVGFIVVIVGGMTNIVLDWLFIAILGWGVKGAAIATAIGQSIMGLFPLIYFIFSKTSRLRFARPLVDMRSLGKVCVNGSSELMNGVAASFVSMLYNMQLMSIAGANGVAAYSVIMYVNFIFTAVFFGFSMGTGPIVSFHFGAQNTSQLKNLLKKSLVILGVFGVAMLGFSQMLAGLLVDIFVGYDPELVKITLHGFRIYAVSFLIMGFNVYGSAFFTALNNGVISAAIAFVRTLVFETSTVMLLPLWFGIDGIWFAIIVAEVCSLILTAVLLLAFRKRYHY